MLKKVKTGIILVLSLISICGKAQQAKSWTDGPLTMSDFPLAGPEAASFADTSLAFFTLVRENKVVESKGVTYKYLDVNAAFLKDRSWVKEGFMSAALLQKHQIEFDLLQYFANLYRDDYLFYHNPVLSLNEEKFDGNKGKMPENEYIQMYNEALDEFHRTGSSSNYSVSREPFDITKLDFLTDKGANDYHLALVGLFPTGDMARLADISHTALMLGYGYREGKNFFMADLSVSPSFFGFRSHYSFSVDYGRDLFSIGKSSLGLYAGLVYSLWKDFDIFSETIASGIGFTQGLCFDVPLHKTYNFLAKSPYVREQKLQFRVYVDEVFIARQRVFTPSIIFSVGFNFGLRRIRSGSSNSFGPDLN